MVNYEDVSIFWDYLTYYPEEDEPDFDGEHYGGIKGIRDDAPDEAKKAFEAYMKEQSNRQKTSI